MFRIYNRTQLCQMKHNTITPTHAHQATHFYHSRKNCALFCLSTTLTFPFFVHENEKNFPSFVHVEQANNRILLCSNHHCSYLLTKIQCIEFLLYFDSHFFYFFRSFVFPLDFFHHFIRSYSLKQTRRDTILRQTIEICFCLFIFSPETHKKEIEKSVEEKKSTKNERKGMRMLFNEVFNFQ